MSVKFLSATGTSITSSYSIHKRPTIHRLLADMGVLFSVI